MSFWNNFFGANGSPYQGFANNEQAYGDEYNPWVTNGQNAQSFLYGQDQNLMSNPSQLQNQLASSFYTSPYQSNLMNQTMNRLNMNSANTGMLGSPSANNYLAGQLNDMTGQFQQNYINNGMQSYGMGMNNMTGMEGMGLNALNSKTGLQEQGAIGSMAAQKTNNSFWPNVFGQTMGAAMAGKQMFGGMGSQSSGGDPSDGSTYQGGAGGSSGWGGVPFSPPSGGFGSQYGGGSTFDISQLGQFAPLMMGAGG